MIDETTRLRISKTLPLLDVEDQRRKVVAPEAEASAETAWKKSMSFYRNVQNHPIQGLKELLSLRLIQKQDLHHQAKGA